MSISQYEKDGRVFWRVYLDLRSRRNSGARVQRRINGIESEKEALAEEKRLLRELTAELARLESLGLRWGEVVDRWEDQQRRRPTRNYALTTIVDHAALLRNWTHTWLDRVASELNRGDGREIDRMLEDAGKSSAFRKRVKNTINVVYTWGIEERLITGVHHSPVWRMEIRRDREERKPEVLTTGQIKLLLSRAKQQEHSWYPIWVLAVLTGCRSGELHQLRRSDVEVVTRDQALEEDRKPADQKRYGMIRIRKSWNVRFRNAGPTKAGHWRTVPVSSELYWFMVNELRLELLAPNDFLLRRSSTWDKGQQATILRKFCLGHGLPSVRFHTLRACFATQLIATGIPPTVVMKICGWRDLKTMQRYIRLAGIDEAGATEVLRFVPSDGEVMEKVVSMYGYRRGE